MNGLLSHAPSPVTAFGFGTGQHHSIGASRTRLEVFDLDAHTARRSPGGDGFRIEQRPENRMCRSQDGSRALVSRRRGHDPRC